MVKLRDKNIQRYKFINICVRRNSQTKNLGVELEGECAQLKTDGGKMQKIRAIYRISNR